VAGGVIERSGQAQRAERSAVAGKPLPEGSGELRRRDVEEVEAAKAAHAWSAESWP